MKLNRARSSSVASPAVLAVTTRSGRSLPAKDVRRWELALAVGLVLAGLAPDASPAPMAAHWTLTDLGRLGAPGSRSDPQGINASGHVAGFESDNPRERAYLYSDGTPSFLATQGSYSEGAAIDAAG